MFIVQPPNKIVELSIFFYLDHWSVSFLCNLNFTTQYTILHMQSFSHSTLTIVQSGISVLILVICMAYI